MNEENITIPIDDYQEFVEAASAVAMPEIKRLAQSVIDSLCNMNSVGFFDEVAPRHFWDEYCWQLQEGPYDEDCFGLGSTSKNFEEVVNGLIESKLNDLPRHMLLFLSIYARNHVDETDDEERIGSVSHEYIATTLLEHINLAASQRNLDLIGPYRSDVISMEISLNCLAGETLSDVDQCSDFLSEYVDQFLVGGADDIADIGRELLNRYMELLSEDEDGCLLPTLLERFKDEIGALVLEKDIRPAVEYAIMELKAALD